MIENVSVVAEQVPLALGNPRRRRLGMGRFCDSEAFGCTVTVDYCKSQAGLDKYTASYYIICNMNKKVMTKRST